MSICEWWMFVATSAVTLIPYTLLLLIFYIMLSRKIVAAGHCCSKQESGDPSAQPQQPPVSSAGGEGLQRPYLGSSDTSSETSEDSDSSPSCPQDSEKNLNYTSLVFPGKHSGPGSAGDYENMKAGTDYVNVDLKKRKVDLWPCSSPVASKPTEYTEVKL